MDNILIKTSIEHTGGISGPQGALYNDGLIYQFKDGGQCLVLDNTYTQVSTFTLPAHADSGSAPHCSSVEWLVPGEKLMTTTCSTGLTAYADKLYIYDISDTSNITQDIVTLSVTNKNKYARMACLAYDSENKIVYTGGYTSESQKLATSPCWFESFDLSGYVDNGETTASRLSQYETSGPGLHFQDGGFYNGYLYYMCDNSNTTNSSYDGLYIWVLTPEFETVAIFNICSDNTSEGESFFLVPGEHELGCVASVVKNGTTFYRMQVGYLTGGNLAEGPIHLTRTLNLVGYKIDGILNTSEDIYLDYGTYQIEAVEKSGSEFYKWSDDIETQSRVINLESGNLELSARAVKTTVYLYALPQVSNYGTSVAAGPTGNFYLILNSQSTRLGEYVMASNIQYNDGDRDITIQGGTELTSKSPSVVSKYFTPLGITEGMWYFPEIPYGYNYFKVSFYNNDTLLDTSTFGTRNPNLFVCGGADYDNLIKLYGNTDFYRPITNEAYYDFSNLKVGTSAGSYVDCAPDESLYKLMTARLDTSIATHAVAKVKIEFFKDNPAE